LSIRGLFFQRASTIKKMGWHVAGIASLVAHTIHTYFSDLTTFFKMLFICLDFDYIHLSFVPVTQQTMAAEYMIACYTNHLQLFPRSCILWELAIHKRLFVRFVLVFFFSSRLYSCSKTKSDVRYT